MIIDLHRQPIKVTKRPGHCPILQIKLTFPDSVSCARCCAKNLTKHYHMKFSLEHWEKILSVLDSWGSWGSQSLSNLSKVTHLINVRATVFPTITQGPLQLRHCLISHHPLKLMFPILAHLFLASDFTWVLLCQACPFPFDCLGIYFSKCSSGITFSKEPLQTASTISPSTPLPWPYSVSPSYWSYLVCNANCIH